MSRMKSQFWIFLAAVHIGHGRGVNHRIRINILDYLSNRIWLADISFFNIYTDRFILPESKYFQEVPSQHSLAAGN